MLLSDFTLLPSPTRAVVLDGLVARDSALTQMLSAAVLSALVGRMLKGWWVASGNRG